MAERLLIVDDEQGMRDLLSIMLRKEGYAVDLAATGEEALEKISRDVYDLIVTDISMPGVDGIGVLRRVREIAPDLPTIVITAYASTESAIEALKLGAYDYIVKPFDVEEFKIVIGNALERKRLERENQYLRRELHEQYRFEGFVGKSPKMREIFSLVERIAGTNSTVLVSGESGTGKELIARATHYNSPRRDRPFVSINCGALTDPLLESELFGHMKGSFTGAVTTKKGLFEVADGGTLFLDEIGETSPAMQIKLLRVLQERRIRRVGGTEEIEVDVRVIAATNQELEALVEERKFREDLFYRINVIQIRMPPLREKKEDIPDLVRHFLNKYSRLVGKQVEGITPEAEGCLTRYGWPGNVRELENTIERAVALETTPRIQVENLTQAIRQNGRGRTEFPTSLPEDGVALEEHLEKLRARFMLEALERANGVQSRAAELLGMSFRSFRYFAKKYSLLGDRSCRMGM
ncbi:MAG: sigma-54-dependent Fis family transcriptional regulator [Acidobacteria bacterium]|nr:sigma-54-dependent Fis family transcriptional regulator [Acidobacteriota bacterium]